MDTNQYSSEEEKALKEALKQILRDSDECNEITGNIAEEFGDNAGKPSTSDKSVREKLLGPFATCSAGLKANATASAQLKGPEDTAKILQETLQLLKDEHDKVSWQIREIVKRRPHMMLDTKQLFEPSETASLSELVALVERAQAWEVALRRELARLLALAKEEQDHFRSTRDDQPQRSHKRWELRKIVNMLVAQCGQGNSTNDPPPIPRPVVPLTPAPTPSLNQQPAPTLLSVRTPKHSVSANENGLAAGKQSTDIKNGTPTTEGTTPATDVEPELKGEEAKDQATEGGCSKSGGVGGSTVHVTAGSFLMHG